MTDIPIKTFDISVRGDVSGNYGEVNADNEQLTHDQDAIDNLQAIAAGTGIISGSVTSNWEFFAENDQAFISTYEATLAGGSGEKDFVLIENPVASGFDTRIKSFTLAIRSNSTNATFRIYKQPTVTANGTPLTIANFRDNASTGVVNTYSVPTISARGNRFGTFDLNSSGTGAVGLDMELALFLLEGEFLLVTVEQYTNNRVFSFNVAWAEEDNT